MNKFLWPFLALLSGAFLPIQAGLNAKLGRAINSPVYASLVSFVVGSFALFAYLMLNQQPVNFLNARSIPIQAWLGGVLGAFYVTIIVFAFTRIGPGLTFSLVIAGQMLLSVFLEHFNILVAVPHTLSTWRILGVALIIAGVVIIRKY